MVSTINHVVKLKQCRALDEVKATRKLTASEYRRFRGMVKDVGLEGASFDKVSWVYPLFIPSEPRVTVFSEEPRRISIGLVLEKRGFVGVVGDADLEAACLSHAGSFLYFVGKIEEKRKGERTFLNVRPRGWLVAEVEGEGQARGKK